MFETRVLGREWTTGVEIGGEENEGREWNPVSLRGKERLATQTMLGFPYLFEVWATDFAQL